MKDPIKKRYLYASIAVFGAISMCIVLFFLLFRMQGIGEFLDSIVRILSPFIYGGVVAYLLRPMCSGFERFFRKRLPGRTKNASETLAIVCSLIVALILVYTLIAMVVPQVYDSVVTMWSAIPSRFRSFLAWADETFGEDERVDVILNSLNTSYEKLYEELGNWVTGTVMPQVTTVISSLGSSMFKVLRVIYNLLIGIIVAVYVLYSRKRFARQCTLVIRSLFTERWAEAILNEVALVDRMFGGFIDAKIVDSAIIGLLCYLGCLIMKMPNTLLVSVFIGVTNVIPFFGPFIGAVPCTLLILIEDPIKAVWFVVFVLILQQFDGNLIGPRIMGNRIGISGFWVMFAIIFFGGTWGLLGMVVGVPLFAVIYDLTKKLVRNGLRNKGRLEMWEQYEADFPNEDIQPVLEPVERMTDWSWEDWKNHIHQFWEKVRTEWNRVYARVLIAWNFLKKWTLVFCRLLKKWTLFIWNAISAFLRKVWNYVAGLCRKIREKTQRNA